MTMPPFITMTTAGSQLVRLGDRRGERGPVATLVRLTRLREQVQHSDHPARFSQIALPSLAASDLAGGRHSDGEPHRFPAAVGPDPERVGEGGHHR